LAQLSPGCRSVFVLFDVVGYKHDEVASLLGCSVGTSKSQLHKARMKLRRLLKTSGQNGTRLMPVASMAGSVCWSSRTCNAQPIRDFTAAREPALPRAGDPPPVPFSIQDRKW